MTFMISFLKMHGSFLNLIRDHSLKHTPDFIHGDESEAFALEKEL